MRPRKHPCKNRDVLTTISPNRNQADGHKRCVSCLQNNGARVSRSGFIKSNGTSAAEHPFAVATATGSGFGAAPRKTRGRCRFPRLHHLLETMLRRNLNAASFFGLHIGTTASFANNSACLQRSSGRRCQKITAKKKKPPPLSCGGGAEK